MKINVLLVLSSMLFFSACKIKSNPTSIGGNKDENGCLTAAGYTWSKLKNKCIRPFEEGISLIEIQPKTSYQRASYALIKNDQAEIFIPEEKESLLLRLENNQNYRSGKYNLKYENNRWTLFFDKTKEYQEEQK